MKYLLPFKQITKDSVDIAGGKAASLGEMTHAGVPVPPGFVVLASASDRFIEETGLDTEIKARIAEVNPDDVNTIERASNVLRDAIHSTDMPEDISKEILAAFDELGSEFVAVRSSATAEDSKAASWAGELDTFLNTTREHVLEKVKECWSSLFTSRAIFYRYEKNLHDSYVGVAVVIQQMIQSEISGITFTVHPVTQDDNQMIIEAGYGLGEAIVSGHVTPDSYVISKVDMMIEDIHIGGQKKKLAKSDIGQNEWIDIHEDGQKQKLSGKQIIELAELCITVEKHYGFPCDIEWAFADGQFYITQSRPITTLNK
ncbi:MAG: hypothetical protein CO029_04565 [Candidatus Magasanikbacteria bacterium CG_4_9_14_0_2_um_filter_41_10]|uniref:Phosphoenolpyruvate synthase n=1 Tax=Candidatus Magasanikbacteria bacterium CG_4_10_14_0_2_um_filter_41_31 TaxID=1974639 RepID=A0A2M7V412_9BACT|nr:MAG: hypothetical protein AUJ37_02460 [Candidatus Magasanikbacteria bacterium CG1_02_41_34]PIZ93259.1 MAG: hypothetical protein COX83_02515 [Candidatus Magasanikbacteria bacterium CG_4_10_14_0_2_um_filter_41_31]PJC53090.1 MAG: hypothetical protein CO029_04565 [Candidatus Magasanikbacteria bacterium CG_4_9_14_0_2_um_filter_41_10]